jgi:hypothetical protein
LDSTSSYYINNDNIQNKKHDEYKILTASDTSIEAVGVETQCQMRLMRFQLDDKERTLPHDVNGMYTFLCSCSLFYIFFAFQVQLLQIHPKPMAQAVVENEEQEKA